VWVAGLLLAGLGVLEAQTSWLQSRLLARAARRITYAVEAGPSPSIRFPASGPYDHRLGYSFQSDFKQALLKEGFQVEAQAHWSPWSMALFDAGLFTIYPEKNQAGLVVLDREGQPLHSARYPARVYERFEEIPPLVVHSLLFIENRELLEDGHANRNPAIEHDRLAKAMWDLGLRVLSPRHPVSGGSTIATQLEKLRHSPGGRTSSVAEKGRQILSASLRAYLDGANTTVARRRIARDYLNSLPLGAIAGYGEVIGFGDGLWAWYDADFATVNQLLAEGGVLAADDPKLLQRAVAYRQALSLLLAIKKPTMYLTSAPAELDARIEGYLQALTEAAVISPALRDAALGVRLKPRDRVALPEVSFAERKAASSVRAELLSRLGLDGTYDLDRLDLTVRATFDRAVNDDVTRVLRQLGDRTYAREAGLMTDRLLGNDNPGRVIYSFTLYERGPHGNELRVQSDNYDNPLNINEGTRLELGSTAKLRTLATYLEIVEELHGRYAGIPAEALRAATPHPRDRLSRWAVDYLARAEDRSLPAMLEAAMNRPYSASPGESFFTGGGVHRFRNFDPKDDDRVMTVREAFQRSVNLVFIRVMRDVVYYHTFRAPGSAGVLEGERHPDRQFNLARFADQEGREFIRRFYLKHQGASAAEALQRLAEAGPRTPARLAVIFRSVRPQAPLDELTAFLRAHGADRGLPATRIRTLYEQYDPSRWKLQDRGHLARIHPLELWLVGYLDRHPAASLAEVFQASAGARQEAYRWLFGTANTRAQDRAVQTQVEVDAFRKIHTSWQRLGYPFTSLVPSYATAIGSSGDNPAALSELVGIILNDGVRYRSIRVAQVHFAQGTPYETHLGRGPATGECVLSGEVASMLRRELLGVIEHGTGRRLAAGVVLEDGRTLEIGGKTGTGDNRFETLGPHGRTSRVVNRTAAFVFTVGDRFFGTIVAFVPGREAATYGFTSALPVQTFKHLLPTLRPLLQEPGPSEPSLPF
jgi:membrane peptidoglycan carboxypeptidase